MSVLQYLSDDQLALIGCAAALAAAGLVMSLSYYLGRWNQAARPMSHRLPQREMPANQRSDRAA